MVKRSSRIPRINAEISEEAAQAFKKALEIRDHREAQLANGDHCQGAGSCSSCDEYERLVALVDTALNIQPQELSPIDVFDAPAPPMWKDRQKEDWDRARAQHVALAKAAGIAPRQKGLLTDGCRAQANIRWIERYGKYPDGLFVGKPFRLHEFQRDIIRGRPCLLAGGRCRIEEEGASRIAAEKASISRTHTAPKRFSPSRHPPQTVGRVGSPGRTACQEPFQALKAATHHIGAQ